MCLALNQECRKKGAGTVYHLPLCSNQATGHACNLVFIAKTWNKDHKQDWDGASWALRLDHYKSTTVAMVSPDLMMVATG